MTSRMKEEVRQLVEQEDELTDALVDEAVGLIQSLPQRVYMGLFKRLRDEGIPDSPLLRVRLNGFTREFQLNLTGIKEVLIPVTVEGAVIRVCILLLGAGIVALMLPEASQVSQSSQQQNQVEVK